MQQVIEGTRTTGEWFLVRYDDRTHMTRGLDELQRHGLITPEERTRIIAKYGPFLDCKTQEQADQITAQLIERGE